ncbi:low molecular weight phosphatase family protein [Paeniglutamicibacter cryotolerans]|uniref:Arsenate-mycothiol transferase n=1 Tax=Paeniglutamicibacter cryotolerans TaxID=670079 RepID=A0A839QRU9_9MICC|nr:low molecular weight phosphatase family protein [Paeniglutamicibacter cryotolerans]MBB2996696.1 arsenate-mycothiol transferase [Paeniglutamicibacter cryotolerans]
MSQKKTRILFVCSSNGGKSQMAAALLKLETGAAFDITSAGVDPARQINALAADVLQDIGADIRSQVPTALTRERLLDADRVVIVGSNARVEPIEGLRMERWVPEEAAYAHLEEHARMVALRDDLHARVRTLEAELHAE